MQRRWWVLGLGAFALTLLVMMPMRWASKLLPESIHCAQWRGSLWRGQCQGLELQTGTPRPFTLPALQWRLHTGALFTLAIQADVQAQLPLGQAQGVLRLRPGGRMQLSDLTGETQLERGMVPALPPDLTGLLVIEDATLALRGNSLTALEGKLRAQNLRDGRGAAYGGYELQFAPGTPAPFSGKLSDTGGPLLVDAILTVNADRSWALQGTLAARDLGNRALNQRLDVIGSADANGRRPLRAEGSFR